MREPLSWRLRFGHLTSARELEPTLRDAVVGPRDDNWTPPGWLLPHQVDAARRIAASLEAFNGAILADAVGLGKTYVALAVAGRFQRTVAVVPAALVSQWKRVSQSVGTAIRIVTHEALSRNRGIPKADLVVVDEAHRFRNPGTRRYDQLARGLESSRLLLVTATPVVNRAADLVQLLRLFCSDCSFSLTGIVSMEETLARRDYPLLTRATAAGIVSRSAESIAHLDHMLPQVRDERVTRASPTGRNSLRALLGVVDSLQFPSVAEAHECALLRLHMLHRLASSTVAFRDTVRRHQAYTERAINAAERGRALSRASARRIFNSEEELQLVLDDIFDSRSRTVPDPTVLRTENQRLRRLLELLSNTNGSSPKTVALERILATRVGRKTIVFTTAIATALELARTLRWMQVAVVGGGKGWIASGRIPVEEVLELFAPVAGGRRVPSRALCVSTLIATDLASEGLDLQDADAVVHFDLPWTPLKLQQRVGRIARLGSRFRTAEVFWFAPPSLLEARLRLERRIAQKVHEQIELHVPATTTVGRARIVNEGLQRRERIAVCNCTVDRKVPGYAVVRGPQWAAVAVRWKTGSVEIPELLVLAGDPRQEISSYASLDRILTGLLRAPNSDADPPSASVELLRRALRRRVASADRGDSSQVRRQLARKVLQAGYEAGKKRDVRLLAVLDAVLERLRAGLNVGGERSLRELLIARPSRSELTAWLNTQPARHAELLTFEIDAALFGDGSTTLE